MKNNFLKISLLTVLAAGIFTGCSNTKEEIGALGLSRCLEPINLTAKIANGDKVTFGWDVTKDAEKYNLVVYFDSDYSKEAFSKTLDAADVPYTASLIADTTYYYKVQATNETGGLEPSLWAYYGKSIKTYAVKDNLFLETSAKTESSITVSWSKDVEDYQDVTHITVCLSEDGSEVLEYELTDEDIAAGSATITGLDAFTEYKVTLFYYSAERGEVDVWTNANTDGYTQISTIDELRAALKSSSGGNFLLKQDGSPYAAAEAETFDIIAPFNLVGEESADGTKPVIQGEFHITSTASGSIIFKSVELDGQSEDGFAIQLKNGGKISNLALDEISFEDCSIHDYTKGLIYEWSQTMSVGSLKWIGCDIYNINKDGSGGGDVIDFRQATTLKSVEIYNNTIYTGGRTFLRMDANVIPGTVKFENNTMYGLCVSDNTNNAGIIALQVAPSEMTFKNNLLLAMTAEKSKLGSDGTASSGGFDGYKYWNGVTYSNNYYYNVASTFFNAYFTENGFTKCDADPCQNAAGGVFNLTNSDLVEAKVGASKWWTAYVEAPEDLTLEAITGNHTWDFGNAKYFSGTIKKEMVRDYLYINASGDLPIVVENSSLTFSDASVLKASTGVPTEGYLAFKVTEPGSVIISVTGDGTGHATVGVGPTDGSSISIKGGAMLNSGDSTPTKIVIKDITEESLVYVYVSGGLTISQLAWSTDTDAVNTALRTPQPTADPEEVTAGTSTDIVISWNAIENADSYSVVFNGKNYSVTDGETSYTIGASTVFMLDPGSYSVQVYANPSEDDAYNTMSDAGTAAFAILNSGESGGSGVIVKTADELQAALDAGKSEIIIGADIDFSNSIVPTTATTITGQDGTSLNGVTFPLTSDCTDLTLDNLTINASGQGLLIDLNSNASTINSITVKNCTIDGYSKSLVYASQPDNNITSVIFYNDIITNQGTGQGGFDFRKGTFGTIQITECTLNGGFRDFIRVDAAVNVSTVDVSQNTFYNLPGKDQNGLLYVRATPGTYTVKNNLFHTINYLLGKSGVTAPTANNNMVYNCGDTFFTGGIDADGIDAVTVTTDPCNAAASGDFTLVSTLAQSLKVGASIWNTSSASSTDDYVTVSSVDEFNAAIEAGKTAIQFAASGSPYEIGTSIELLAGMQLSGEVSGSTYPTVSFTGFTVTSTDNLGSIVIENLTFEHSGDNFINVSAAANASSITVRNCNISGTKKSVYYGPTDGTSISALNFDNVMMSNLGGGQGTIDIRKGTYSTVSITNCTVNGGRDFIRADKNTVTGSINISNNLFDSCTLNNGNGVLYVRATPDNYYVKNNLFLNEDNNGEKGTILVNSKSTVPTMNKNYFYNCTATKFWTGVDEATATTGGGILDSDPCSNASSLNYTLTNSTLISAAIGPERWR